MNAKTLLAPCPSCARHVRATDARCPFCDGALDPASLFVPVSLIEPGARLGRAAVLALGAAAALVSVAGCNALDRTLHPDHGESHGSADIYGSPPAHDPGTAVSAYGAPIPQLIEAPAPAYGIPPPVPHVTPSTDASVPPHRPRAR